MLPPAQQLLNNQNFQVVKQLFNLVKNSNNPQAMLANIVAQNPQFQPILALAKQGNLQNIYLQLAQQYNIDPNLIIN